MVLLGILGASFLSFNAWTIAPVIAHYALLNSPAEVRLFATTNGLIVGMAIPLVVSLVRNRAEGRASRNEEESTE